MKVNLTMKQEILLLEQDSQTQKNYLEMAKPEKFKCLCLLKNAIVIPQKATYEIQDKKYVFVVDKNNKVNVKRNYYYRRNS